MYREIVRVGDVIDGRFLLERQAGAGGMGVVYRARDRISGGPVAIKAVIGAYEELERLDRETAALSRIAHPRIVRYVAHGGDSDDRYLAMEWLDGEDLSQRLVKGTLVLEDALRVVRGIAEALEVLHASGIVHRDIKPSNVFLVGETFDNVKLLDLGIARTQDVAWTLTATGAFVGTPAYMAPEQARGESVDERADIFALGCVFYECLVGSSPFAAAHPVAALARILMDDPPRLRDVGVNAPVAVEALLESLLAKDRDARMASASDVLRALGRLDQQRSTLDRGLSASSITFVEQQIVSMVLTRPASGRAKAFADTNDEARDEHIRAIAAAHDARLELLPNGSYFALFTSTASPTDHAAHAAAFALELAVRLEDDAIALTTGRGQISGRLPVGNVIDRAVALLEEHRSGILLDSVSASLLEGRFAIDTKGDVFQLLRANEMHAPRRTVAGQVSPCMGRERELSAIAAALATSIDGPMASAVLLTASPGTGKSRIVDEVLRTVGNRDDVALLLVGGCDMMNAGARHGVLARALQAAVRHGSAEGTDARQWLEERMRANGGAGDADRVAELIAESCGLIGDRDPSAFVRELRDNPLLLADAIVEAWCTWLFAESEKGAVVLVLEDLHWGDLPTIKLVEQALRQLEDRPLFILATARPEVHETFPRLWAERSVQEIRLGAIAPRSTERLVKRLLGPNAPDDIVRRIVERSGGHPFLLEELVRAAFADPSKLDDVPETVLGMLQARFFRQSELSRAALRAASIFGMTFWLGGAESLLAGVGLEGEFDGLIAAEFIERRSNSRIAGHVEYAFRHALVRDAAYAMLTDDDRRAGHVLAGSWLEGAGERAPLVLAEHFDRGGALDRAAAWYHRAAAEALEGNDLARAIHLAKRAMDCGRNGADRAMTELILADAMFGTNDLVGSHRYAVAARERLECGTDAWFSATDVIIASLGQRGLNDEVFIELDRAVSACTSPATDAQLICIARGISQLVWVSRDRAEPFATRLCGLAEQSSPGPLARAWLARVRGELIAQRWHRAGEVAALSGEACAEFERAGALRIARMMQLHHCIALAYAGRAHEAVAILQKAMAEIEQRGWSYLLLFAKLGLVTALFFDDRDEACVEVVDPVLEALRPSFRMYLHAVGIRAFMAFDAKDYAKAYEISEELVGLDNLSDYSKLGFYGFHARVLVALGRIDEAIEWGERAIGYATPTVDDPYGELGYVGLAEALLARGEKDRARAVVERFWKVFLSLPVDHATYPRRRVFRELAALAHSFGMPYAAPANH